MKRRLFLAGAAGVAALPACANAPQTSARPVLKPGDAMSRGAAAADGIIARAGLGGRVGFAVADVETGQILEAHNPLLPLPPASVAKAVTALYALETLGAGFRFVTRLVATGPIVNGRLDGDLVLVGGGDPALDTDGLHDLAGQAKAAGLREVKGRLLVDALALPVIERIDRTQPDHVGYNPAIGALNLNFNRVHFGWQRSGSGYQTTMQARTERFRPGVSSARIRVADRSLPVYTYEREGDVDSWTVARGQLGNAGSRWLPVRRPDLYAGDVLHTMLRSNGITVTPARPGTGRGTTIATSQSAPLDRIVASMLRYSTNLVAEVIGLTATTKRFGRPSSLGASADAMSRWIADQTRARRPDFDDHSGLNGSTRISAADMVGLLTTPGAMPRLRPLLRDMTLEGPPAQVIQAKTGTLNFVSGLAGYFDAPSGRTLAFATFTADTERRNALGVAERERPRGGRAWAQRSRSLQFDLIERWSMVHT
ncbi:D-alanyl-D-alanine carboxypeptidase DacB precursor [Jannaschia seosinensis]|uniref:D-alanyl-D-alanine carboxypeptidase DacB n=1 Tax=Jannaschia seosinensis TaxID=313367 RepID=A0A0M7B8D6_9RHOB|nr:D-alanyl-D-alanine carboxypeptidase/D-alanyl-D-alanine-endopeptidase [Jannaschia seosinensis]CUH12681.1 D-alanyl-D-alanine carboxypeptidase DacB precursor [Jannaschia seosinensis]